MYTAGFVASLFPQGQHLLIDPEAIIQHICIDSRKAAWQPNAMFLALKGARIDGHRYIRDAWQQGVRTFLIQENWDTSNLPTANYILVPDVLQAFHHLARYHRKQYTGKVIAITGSNGKTWVKEWLYMLLYQDHQIYRSPGSYNSQVGVPLSVWYIPADAKYALIEAGISTQGEMKLLEDVIQPDTVVFTHFGDAHDEGFAENKELKLAEKMVLTQRANTIIFPADIPLVADFIHTHHAHLRTWSWSVKGKGNVNATYVKEGDQTSVTVHASHQTHHYTIPFTGMVAIANSLCCLATIESLGLLTKKTLSHFQELRPIDMRLKAEDAIQGCVLINDSYSLDLDSLQYALESLEIAGATRQKTLILSDHAHGQQRIYEDLARMIAGAGVDKLICIGQEVSRLIDWVPPAITCLVFSDVEDLFRKGSMADFQDEAILLKGARRFGFERIARHLRLRSHSAVLEIDFAALDNNLRYFYKNIQPGVKKIAVVKANAYGAGSLEVCRFLSYQHIDMLAVAVIDEGIELREAGISLPVIVLNPDPEGMDLILKHQLQPEIYNLHILQKLLEDCRYHQEKAIVHIKLDTGTHRLGFGKDDIPHLISMLRQQEWIQVSTIFSHLSASDDPQFDDFTREQVRRFDEMYNQLTDGIGYRPDRHILSSAGVLRCEEFQFECVRLGIGLYGVGFPAHTELMAVHSLKARILHIQDVEPGESVSYSRSFMADRRRRIATVNIGYADGIPRMAGDVGCSFLIKGKPAIITGRVCMDMTMVDVSAIPEAEIGDEVVIFDKINSIEDMASKCHTIAYEILTHLNPRIRKVYQHG